MGDLERILPSDIVDIAVRSGNELVIPFDAARRSIAIANENRVAVLGVEVFRVLDAGLGVETYSGYGFEFEGDWPEFVHLNNDAASRFLDEHRFGEGYGYILTATSKGEFEKLKPPPDR